MPVEIAKKLKASGQSTLILSFRDDPDVLKPYAEKVITLKAPSLGRGLREIKNFGADKLIMAGFIPKRLIYCLPLLFDKISRSVLRKSLLDDHSLLGAIVKVFEDENIKVIPYWQILPEFIASAGKLSQRLPSEKELKDINYGEKILRVTLPCSFGQALCVADGSVVAVEGRNCKSRRYCENDARRSRHAI